MRGGEGMGPAAIFGWEARALMALMPFSRCLFCCQGPSLGMEAFV